MTPYEFNNLDEMEQIEMIWEAAIVAKRNDGDFEVLLYSIDDFYVEVYSKPASKFYSKIRSFKNIGPLEAYLPSIDISSIF